MRYQEMARLQRVRGDKSHSPVTGFCLLESVRLYFTLNLDKMLTSKQCLIESLTDLMLSISISSAVANGHTGVSWTVTFTSSVSQVLTFRVEICSFVKQE